MHFEYSPAALETKDGPLWRIVVEGQVSYRVAQTVTSNDRIMKVELVHG